VGREDGKEKGLGMSGLIAGGCACVLVGAVVGAFAAESDNDHAVAVLVLVAMAGLIAFGAWAI
jgi:hypothetical protein